MNIFATAVDILFRDPNMAADAIYRPGGSGDGQPVRVVRRTTDPMADFNGGRFIADGIQIDVRVSECPDLAPGDRFIIGASIFEVQGEPRRDGEGLVWKAAVRAL